MLVLQKINVNLVVNTCCKLQFQFY